MDHPPKRLDVVWGPESGNDHLCNWLKNRKASNSHEKKPKWFHSAKTAEPQPSIDKCLLGCSALMVVQQRKCDYATQSWPIWTRFLPLFSVSQRRMLDSLSQTVNDSQLYRRRIRTSNAYWSLGLHVKVAPQSVHLSYIIGTLGWIFTYHPLS